MHVIANTWHPRTAIQVYTRRLVSDAKLLENSSITIGWCPPPKAKIDSGIPRGPSELSREDIEVITATDRRQLDPHGWS
jgi:hypothetical protein